MASTITQHGQGTARSLRGLVADSAYASVGLGSAAVELMRSIDRVRVQTPQRARAIGRQAPERLRHLVEESTVGLPRRAAREFDGFAQRGRDLVGAIRTNSTTLEAIDRTRTARSRLKAAGTSATKAAESAVQATERAAAIVAARTEPAQRPHVAIQPPVQPAKARVTTRRAPSGRRPGARRPVADQPVSLTPSPSRRQAHTGPYEKRTVEELRERANELGIEGSASMTKDELITALREQRS
jgi:hypothetical protein